MMTGHAASDGQHMVVLKGSPADVIERILDSSRFDSLPPEQASALIRNVHVFTRFNPAQKRQIIQTYMVTRSCKAIFWRACQPVLKGRINLIGQIQPFLADLQRLNIITNG